MKEKILFYIDTWFIHFGIAKAIQEKYDCDLYTIIDVDDKAKQFFLNQNFVKFSTTWYLMDYIQKPNKKPDLNYLKSFENKYQINLWRIAYAEREFYSKYNDHYRFTDDEILSLIEQECRFYEEVFDKLNPDYFFTYIPINHEHYLLHQICKSKGIKILILGPIRFGNRMMISEEPLKIDYMEEQLKLTNVKEMTLQEIQDYMHQYDAFKSLKENQKINFETNKLARYKSILNFFISKRTDNHKRYSNFGKSKFRVFITKIKRASKRRIRQAFINKHFLRKGDDLHYVYFPLHFEPERLLLIDVPFYENQLAVITNIAKSLPVDYKLYVKEHPMMKTHAWREISFYKQIMDLPNVRLIHPSVKPDEIIKNSSLVITIAGTTGQEAALYNVPTITFTDQIYSISPSVYKINKIEELPSAIKICLQKKVDPKNLNKLVDIIEKNTFEYDHKGMTTDFAYRFGFKGPVMDALLPYEKVKLFLNEYHDVFERLADEHLKKMEQHKQHQKNLNKIKN